MPHCRWRRRRTAMSCRCRCSGSCPATPSFTTTRRPVWSPRTDRPIMGTVRYQTRAQHGFSLIEIMIGIVIGLIAVLVIYQVFALAEGIKRNTTSVGDAQQNGLLSSFILNVQLANAN